MPLKAIVRGHSYAVVPTSWTNRTSGEAKLAMKEMGSRYLFIVLYVWLENDAQPRRLPGAQAGAAEGRLFAIGPYLFPFQTQTRSRLPSGIATWRTRRKSRFFRAVSTLAWVTRGSKSPASVLVVTTAVGSPRSGPVICSS